MGLGIIYILFLLYTQRALLFFKYDAAYWQDRFDHSQWRMALSPRTLGDDGLYKIEGYLMVKGADPTMLNAEVPPLGKYLIGLSLVFWGNTAAYSILTTLLAVFLLYLLAHELTRNQLLAVFAALLFLFDPLLTNQFTLAMLDVLQLDLLLLFFLLLVKLFRSQTSQSDLILSVICGLALGLFAETKIAVFLPLLLISALWLLWQKKAPFIVYSLLGIGFGTGYLLPYLPYFLQGHSLSQWLAVQKWVINFYRGNLLTPKFGNVITQLLVNRQRDIFSGNWENGHEWSAVWPIITVIGIYGLLKMEGSKRDRVIPQTLTFYLLSMFLILNLVPFWSRFLVLLLPFFYLGTVGFIWRIKSRLKEGLLQTFLIVNLLYSLVVLFPKPNDTLTQFFYSWQHGFFQDMYEFITGETKQHLSQAEFHTIGLTSFYDGEIENVKIDWQEKRFSRFTSPQNLSLNITYCTRNLGCFEHQPTITVVKQSGQWKILWQWENLYPMFNHGTRLKTEVELARRGSILSPEGEILAQDTNGTMISIIPNQVVAEEKENLFRLLENIFDQRISGLGLNLRLYNNSLGYLPQTIGVPPKILDKQTITELQKYDEIILQDWPFRNYAARLTNRDIGQVGNVIYEEFGTLLYSPTSYQGVSGLEKEFNEMLCAQNGGNLSVIDTNGAVLSVLISNEKIDGKDVKIQ